MSDTSSKTRRQLHFAKVSVGDQVLTVQTLKDPFLYDLRVLAVEHWLPMMLLGCGLFYAVSGFHQVLPSMLAGLFMSLVCAAVLARALWDMRTIARYTFDRVRDEVCINGHRVGSLAQIAAILLQTHWGWLGNRRFRLILRLDGGKEWVMAQTPLLEDGTHAQQYYGETYSKRWMSNSKPWADYYGERDAVDDERDLEIFVLTETVQQFINVRSD